MKFATSRAWGALPLLALSAYTSNTYAQGVGSGSISALPAASSISIAATLVALATIAFFALRNRNFTAALIGPSLLIAGATALVVSPDLQAINPITQVQFTDPSGEYIDLQPQFSSGIREFEITNTTGKALKIVRVEDPDPSDCLLQPVKPEVQGHKGEVKLEAPGYPTCTVGDTLEVGSTCKLNFWSACVT
ncbi:midcut-by-XrtH protein [Gilvimarinus sp. 1_MG-2023]|uniref:midcut-by-XrtH protein n=1 Tax=Gilvimarinus sp. 1_MG-2023 TaxID=3062638 RepID=UPI0026E286C0|nr:midcut-by-XrtH protein [Gilvimarinus sp. 1_MG-2023]MDO6748027.1 midcut-by-XrtH protein [Gilvimarinus sp. 1_MG-2023]